LFNHSPGGCLARFDTGRTVKVVVLDVYPKRPYRICKDTNGGFGTGNDYGDSFVARTLRWLIARNIDWPPLFAAYTASVLRDKGHEVEYSRDPARACGADLCLLVSSIVAHESEIDTIRQLCRQDCVVGAIGPFAATKPAAYVDAGAFVIAGEPEMFFLKTEVDKDSVAKLAGVVAAKNAELDELPYPAWDLIYRTYPPKFALLGNKAVLPIAATRGCPYSCFHYCVYPLQQGRKVRKREPAAIVAEMAHWQDTLGISCFIFRDPVFSVDRRHTLALCDEIAKSGRKFSFIVETHLNNLDEEVARRLAAAGLVMVKVGVESVDLDVMQAAKRFSIPIDEQRKRIRLMESLGIGVTCMFILGFPTDTRESCRATIDYAKRLNTAFAQFSVFTPLPGTPAFREFEDLLNTNRMEDFTLWHLVFRHNKLTAQDIRELLGEAYGEYYARPRWAWKYASARLRFRRMTKKSAAAAVSVSTQSQLAAR